MIHLLFLVWHNVKCVLTNHLLTFLCALSNFALLLLVLSVFLLFVCLFRGAVLPRGVGSTSLPSPPPHSPVSCDVVSFNQSGVLKHNTLTLGMLYQGRGHGQGRSSTLNFNLYNNTRHEPPAGHWLPLPPPPSAIAVSIPTEINETLVTPTVTAYILVHLEVIRTTSCVCLRHIKSLQGELCGRLRC